MTMMVRPRSHQPYWLFEFHAHALTIVPQPNVQSLYMAGLTGRTDRFLHS